MDFRILGPLEVREGNREVGLRGGKQRALLALLLVNANRTLGLDRIVDELWGEDVPETAQKMVQIYVSRLRKVLPPGMLHTRPPGYALALEREQLDLHRFERLVTEARASLDAGRAEQASAGFRAALGLWRGPALAEFASEPFAQPEGARLEEFRLSALEERIEADLALGRHADLAGELEALVARDPLRERLRGQQMLALYRGGRQADALAAYHEGRRLLEEELGIDPSPALRDLERRILQQDQALELVSSIPQERRAASARPTRRSRSAARAEAIEPARSPFATAFVGRDGELGRLRRLLDEALAGHRQVVFVSGRPGIGKTALVRIFLEEAQARGGLLVGRGQCFEQYGHGEAFMPVLEAVGRLCRGSDGDELIPLLAARAPTWLSQLPGLAESVGANVGALAVGATRERMLRELVEVLEAITRTRPLALLLEDLHWSDPSTVDALSALTRRDDPARLLLIGTYRPQDARAGSHPVWEAVQALEQRGLASEIRLQALASGAVADYLELRFPESELPFDLSGLLHDRTEGNPLFIEKVVDSWVEGGSIAVVDGVFALKATLPELSVGVPGTVRQLIEHQLDELDGADEELLEAASVAGAEFVAAAVAAACERADDDTERRLAELARQGRFVEVLGEAVWPDGTVSTRYAFVHDLYAEVGYARLSPGRRARLHRAIGARLQSAFGDGAGEVAGELATHLLRGREPDKAITYLDAAAKHALARGGHREAIEHLTTALDALGELPGTRERSERELALQITLGNALIAGRGYAAPETSETYARARELCAELGESAPDFLPVLYGLWNNEIVAASAPFGTRARRRIPPARARRRRGRGRRRPPGGCLVPHPGRAARTRARASRRDPPPLRPGTPRIARVPLRRGSRSRCRSDTAPASLAPRIPGPGVEGRRPRGCPGPDTEPPAEPGLRALQSRAPAPTAARVLCGRRGRRIGARGRR